MDETAARAIARITAAAETTYRDRIGAQLAQLRTQRDEVRRQAERDISYLNGAIEALEALIAPPALPTEAAP